MSIMNAHDLVTRQKEYLAARQKLVEIQETLDKAADGGVLQHIPFVTLQNALDDCIESIQATLGTVKFQWPPVGHAVDPRVVADTKQTSTTTAG